MPFPISEITKPDYSTIIMVQIDKTQAHKLFINIYPNVYFFNTDALYPYINSSLLAGISSYDYQTIGSIIFGDVIGNIVNTISEIKTVAAAFFISGKNIYIHGPENKRPSLFNITLGVALGFRHGGGGSSYFNNLFYDDRAISIPSISKAKNDLYSGRSAFEGGTIELNNEDGELDELFEEEDYEGNNIRAFLGFEGYNFPDDFKKIITGYIEEIARGSERITLSEKDQRKRLQFSLPNRFLDSITWPNLEENNYNAPIPLIYGPCRNIPVVCVNEKEDPTPTNYRFVICDTTYHDITTETVLPYIEKTAVTTRTVQYDTTNKIAYFEIPSAASEYNPGDEVYIAGWNGSAETVIEGYKDDDNNNIEYALDVIKDLLINYYGITFTDSFFNFAHWDNASDLKIGLFINESKELTSWIDSIISSSFITFIVEDDGRFSGRIFNRNGAIIQYLYKEDILNYPEIISTTARLIASTQIGYSRDYANNKLAYYNDSSNLATTKKNYQFDSTKKIDTLLTSVADAKTFSDYLLDLFLLPEKTVEIETNLITVERELGDIIQLELARPHTVNTKSYYKAEIIKINKNITGGKNKLTCRIFEKTYKTIFTTGCEWGNNYWGNTYWCKNYYRKDLMA